MILHSLQETKCDAPLLLLLLQSTQKHLDIILDESLSFEEHLKTISVKNNKTAHLLRKLQNLLPRPALITLYKPFIRP